MHINTYIYIYIYVLHMLKKSSTYETCGCAGFNNYHKIAVRDHVRVPKFWRTWRTLVNTKKHISGVVSFT